MVSRKRSRPGRLSRGLLGLLGLGLLLLGGLALGLGGGVGRGGRGLGLAAVRRRPERQVVAEELHDQGAVAVRLLGERVELGDGVVKRLLREVASTVGRVEDLVVEDGEVQGQTEADGVGGGELSLSDIGGALRVAGLVNGHSTSRGTDGKSLDM